MQLACAFWGSNFEILEHGTGWMVEKSEEERENGGESEAKKNSRTNFRLK